MQPSQLCRRLRAWLHSLLVKMLLLLPLKQFSQRSKMSLLSRLKIRTKLASIVVLAALTVCAIIAIAASLSERRMLDDRVAQLRTAVDMMVGMAQTLQDEVAAGKMTLAEAKNQFRL